MSDLVTINQAVELQTVTLDLNIEVLDRRVELLAAAAGTCTSTTTTCCCCSCCCTTVIDQDIPADL